MSEKNKPIDIFANEVPDGAEWVIKFRQKPGGTNKFDRYAYCASGLALMLKKR